MYNKSIRIVMKKAFIVIIAAVATIACTKESNIQDRNLALEDGLLSIEATVAPFVDDATKASISVNGSGAVTGTFSWSAGDQIAFPVTASGSPAYVPLTYNSENGKFEGTLGDGQEVNYSGTIYYPASVVIGPTYSTNFASIDAAKAGFKMTASVPASLSQKITMTHESALVHVQFSNVPSFADELVVNDGSKDIAKILIGVATGTVDFYVPITPEGSKEYTFSIEDTSDNAIISVSKEKTLTAGSFYNTPSVAIGPIVLIENRTMTEAVAGEHGSSGLPGDIDYYPYSGDFNDDNLKSVTINEVNYKYYVYPESAYNTTQRVIIHHDNFEYPRVETAVKLNSHEQYYTFGYTTGLRLTSNTGYTFYVYSQDKTNVDLYVWSPSELFGTWASPDESKKGFIQNGGDASSNRIYYFDLTGISTYSFKLHNGNTNYCDDQNGISVSGNVYWAVYSNSGGTWNYTEASFNDEGIANWIYTW